MKMQRQRYRFTSACLLVLLAILVTLSACDPLSWLQDPPDPPTPLPVQPTPVHQPYRVIDIWLATTQTYPRTEFSLAKQKIAQSIDDAVQVNSDGMQVTIGLLGGNSFANAPVMTITIPKIDADPAEPALKPTPTEQYDPFANKDAGDTVAEQNGKATDQYQQDLRRHHAYLDQVRKQVRVQTDQLRSLNPPVMPTEDIWSAVGRSAKRFQGVQATKQLILATDFEAVTYAQFVPDIYLPAVAVSVIFYYNADQQRYEQNMALWKNSFINSGASSANFYDDVQSQGLSLFS